eukprot:TRINITY_DN12646_c0_g1_i1.p1 TRINITY_DN12646_c0_g1~~TRINITY_DN12646_c0_g1_i1.p1  ORF type:complete len:378 (+),score=43.86 TRINITY_DN12646_c0_g1_i1:236-1369(+)
MKGLPINVRAKNGVASFNAILSIWDSAFLNGTLLMDAGPGVFTVAKDFPRMLDSDPKPDYLEAHWMNPYRSTGIDATPTPFSANWHREMQGVNYRLKLVTSLNARDYSTPNMLYESAIAAERIGGPNFTFTFMKAHDGARGVLDYQYPAVMEALSKMQYRSLYIPTFQTNYHYKNGSFSSFMVGTPTIGTTIESNLYAPGSIVDNLTSFGAVPRNFDPTGESQVSISRWVEKGVASVHGTTAEPLNNCFPDRYLIVDYVRGATIGEAWFRRLPFVYWRSMILGDVMAAPYANKPNVTLQVDVEMPLGGVAILHVTASATISTGLIEDIFLYADGIQIAYTKGHEIKTTIHKQTDQILAVASAAEGWKCKGWNSWNGK